MDEQTDGQTSSEPERIRVELLAVNTCGIKIVLRTTVVLLGPTDGRGNFLSLCISLSLYLYESLVCFCTNLVSGVYTNVYLSYLFTVSLYQYSSPSPSL